MRNENQLVIAGAAAGRTSQPCADMTFREWIHTATACLEESWPAVDRRQLQGIAVELFRDPYRGVLEPRQAVREWMQPLQTR